MTPTSDLPTPDLHIPGDGTLGGLLRAQAAARPHADALVIPAWTHGGEEQRLSFAQLDTRADALAAALLDLGLRPGEHVALWAANLPHWVPLEYALARAGLVLVTVNTALKASEVGYVLRQSKAVAVLHSSGTGSNDANAVLDALLADPEQRPTTLRLRAWLPSSPTDRAPEGLLPRGDADPERGTPLDLRDLEARGAALPDEPLARVESTLTPDDVVNIQYTSGTTGFPKGVMLSHRNLLSSAVSLAEMIRVTDRDRTLLMVPLFHCFGCVVAVLGSHVRGAALCVLPGFDPEHALRLVHEERCSVIHGVPTMYSAMLAHPERARFDTTSLRTGLAAGAPCPEPLMRALIEDLHCTGITVTYGLTEAAPGVSGSNPEDSLQARCGTIGRALPGVELRIVCPDTRVELPRGERGELWVRGANVMVGYHDDPAATAEAVSGDGWLRTGDLCTLDDEDRLRIVGRAKDLIIRGGENIAPAEIENLLREHPQIVDASVVGVPDAHFGEELAAALILATDASLDPDSYRALLSGRLASFKVPRHWVALERFPLTGSGKVRKFKLREALAVQLGLAPA
ncbi:MAG: AMP-binding protein [Planctomycetota bacterium]|nr:MAG: AMP-binding protein [Planctomycetota bacterium]